MKGNRLLAAGILSLSLISCSTLASCSTSSSSLSHNSDSSIVPPDNTDSLPQFQTKSLTPFSYVPYAEAFSVTKENENQIIEVANNVYTISSAGSYTLSGNLTAGRIEVKKGIGSVTLILDNVSVSGIDAAIGIKSGNNVTLTAAEGSVNYFKDGSADNFAASFVREGQDEPKGTIFSKSKLTVDGAGSIYIISSAKDIEFIAAGIKTYEDNNGIYVKNDLKIAGTNIYVNSVNNGIKNKGSLNIASSNIEIAAENDGISSDYNSDIAPAENKTGIITLNDNTIAVESKCDAIQAEYGIEGKSGTYYLTAGENGSSGPGDIASHKGLKVSFKDVGSLILETLIKITGGTYYIDSFDDSIHADDAVIIQGGTLVLKSGDDAVHADKKLTVEGETTAIIVLSSMEGFEAPTLTINSGFSYIVSADNGIDTGDLLINNGTIVVNAAGDGLDSSGEILVTGGTIIVNAADSGNNLAVDFEANCLITGGLFVAAGPSNTLKYPSLNGQKILCATSETIYNSDTYYGIFDSAGNLVAAFSAGYNSASIFFSSPELSSADTYTVYGGGSYSGGTTSFGLAVGGTYSGGSRLSIKNT